jgi:RNA polymerase sigma-54 factor
MSVRLTTSLSQRLVLTPQLRQRIEMLQMTTLELSDLIQQQLTENPVLEEVATQEEARELAEKILDHMASGGELENFEAPTVEASMPGTGEPSSNGAGESETGSLVSSDAETDFAGGESETLVSQQAEDAAQDASDDARDSFEEVDFGREFQDYLDPGYKTQEFEYKEDAPTFEQFLTKAPSLNEHLEWQLHMDSPEGEISSAAEAVIGNLDEDGRLNATNEEIAAQGGWS